MSEKPPIYTYNEYLKKRFQTRVYKISLDGGFTCPNRDGTKGKKGCIFCDEKGSSSRTHCASTPIEQQAKINIDVRKSRYGAKKFIAYFQSFTNTYAPCDHLKKIYDKALFSHPDIIGLSISTRPDCIDEEKVKMIAEYKKKFPYVCIELGMQSIHDKTLSLINRQESHKDFLAAYDLLKKYELEHCVHVILGLPDESPQEQIATAKKLAYLQVQGIKIHTLVAMENTPLAKLYHEGKWSPLGFDEHIHLLCDFLEYIHPTCIIHRLSGNGHPHHLIAPQWIKTQKTKILPSLYKEFLHRETMQGFHHQSKKIDDK